MFRLNLYTDHKRLQCRVQTALVTVVGGDNNRARVRYSWWETYKHLAKYNMRVQYNSTARSKIVGATRAHLSSNWTHFSLSRISLSRSKTGSPGGALSSLKTELSRGCVKYILNNKQSEITGKEVATRGFANQSDGRNRLG